MRAPMFPLLSIPSPSSSTIELGPLLDPLLRADAARRHRGGRRDHGHPLDEARRRLGPHLPRRRLGRRVRDHRCAPLPRRHELGRATRRVVGAVRDLEGRARRLGRDRARLHRRRDRGEALGRLRREARRLRRAGAPASRRASVASGTGGTRSSSGSRPTSPGASRSTPRTGRSTTSTRRRSSRRSCTRPSGASPPPGVLLLIERRFKGRIRPGGLFALYVADLQRRPALDRDAPDRPVARDRWRPAQRVRRRCGDRALGGFFVWWQRSWKRGRPAAEGRDDGGSEGPLAGLDASGCAATPQPVPPMPVRELELELDAFEGPFDLLLTLLLKEELEPRRRRRRGIVLAFVERLAEARAARPRGVRRVPRPRLRASRAQGARSLPGRGGGARELEPEEAAEELARRLAEYRRMKEAAAGSSSGSGRARPLLPRRTRAARAAAGAAARGAGSGALGDGAAGARSRPPSVLARAPGAPLPARVAVPRAVPRDPRAAAAASTSTRRSGALSRVEQAVAFSRCSSCARARRSTLAQSAPFAPSGFRKPTTKGDPRGTAAPPDRRQSGRPARTDGRGAPRRRLGAAHRSTSWRPRDDDAERIETALGLLRERFREGRSGIVLEFVAGGLRVPGLARGRGRVRAALRAPVERGLSQAAIETLAIVAYLGPCSRPDIARIRGVAADSVVASLLERGLDRARRGGRRPGRSATARRRSSSACSGSRASSELPRLDDLGETDGAFASACSRPSPRSGRASCPPGSLRGARPRAGDRAERAGHGWRRRRDAATSSVQAFRD